MRCLAVGLLTAVFYVNISTYVHTSQQIQNLIKRAFPEATCIIVISQIPISNLKLKFPVIRITNVKSLQNIQPSNCHNILLLSTPEKNKSVENIMLKLLSKKILLPLDKLLIISANPRGIGKKLIGSFSSTIVIKLSKTGPQIYSQHIQNLQGDVDLKARGDVYDLPNLFKSGINSIKGSNMRLGTFAFPPSIIFDEKNERFEGLDIDIARIYAEYLKLNLKIIEPADGLLWGAPTNDSRLHTGNTGMIVHGEVDIGVANYFLMHSYLPYAKYIYPHDYDTFGALAPPRKRLAKWKSLIVPFKPTTWLIIFTFVIFCYIAILSISKTYKRVVSKPVGILDGYVNAATYNIQALFGSSASNNASPESLKVYISLLWAAYFFVGIYYKSSLLANLAAPLFEPPIETFEDAYQLGLSVVSTGDSFLRSFEESSDPIMQALAERFYVSIDMDQIANDIANDKIIFMESSESLKVKI
ncbi:hypothetical protein QYM36_016831 [Artemia franciscana]|uniref:Ionotropic receptor n=1 Tax=Artemia franciscana TaxID=6661 RepID=A0AA88L1U9_ARTSF|nr:hypothetical protein QYM36_016831 [Artemia franciscana]